MCVCVCVCVCRGGVISNDVSFKYIKSKSGHNTDAWGTPQNTDAGWEKLFPELTKYDLLDK